MNLYEITNGWMGCSYVRQYAWAESEQQAKELAYAAQTNGPRAPKQPVSQSELKVRLLMAGAAEPFATAPDDEGWPE